MNSCGTCTMAVDEEWVKGKRALRCGSEGEHRGWVVDIYPEGLRVLTEAHGAPAWCPKGTEKEEVLKNGGC